MNRSPRSSGLIVCPRPPRSGKTALPCYTIIRNGAIGLLGGMPARVGTEYLNGSTPDSPVGTDFEYPTVDESSAYGLFLGQNPKKTRSPHESTAARRRGSSGSTPESGGAVASGFIRWLVGPTIGARERVPMNRGLPHDSQTIRATTRAGRRPALRGRLRSVRGQGPCAPRQSRSAGPDRTAG